jgi:ketosteroid isomerase-like protein
MRSAEIAAAFVARINAHDLAGLAALMAEDHVFVDALDNRTAGRDVMRSGWQHYLALVPDYWIRIEKVLCDERTVALFGRAGGTCASDTPQGQPGKWEVPAAWLAEIRDGQVATWRVYADNLPLRRLMGVERG